MQLTKAQQAELSQKIKAVEQEVDGHIDRVHRLDNALKAAQARLHAAEGYLQCLQQLQAPAHA